MLDLLMVLAAAAQDAPLVIVPAEPPQGPMVPEFRTLSQPHPNDFPEGSFPDLAVKEMRIDGDTLHVRVANEGRHSARGPIRVTAEARIDGVRSHSPAAKIGTLKAGESKWVALTAFTGAALHRADRVSASVSLPPATPAALDRSGQLRDRIVPERDQSNNHLAAAGAALVRSRP